MVPFKIFVGFGPIDVHIYFSILKFCQTSGPRTKKGNFHFFDVESGSFYGDIFSLLVVAGKLKAAYC